MGASGLAGGLPYTWDGESMAGYVTVADGPVKRTVDLGVGILVDVHEDGSIHGVEVLGAANAQWMLMKALHVLRHVVMPERTTG